MVNPASIKQVLLEGAEIVPVANVFEQGAGKLNLLRSFELLRQYTPRLSAFPAALDLTDCPYMWPHCAQPLFYGARPITLNVTLLNGMGVVGELVGAPAFVPGKNGAMLEVAFTHSDVLWPWSGFVAPQLRVAPAAALFEGDAEGLITVTVQSPPGPGERRARLSTVQVPLRVRIVRPPPRQKRLLWDQFHNLRYPPGYFPRDVLSRQDEPFDWNADHPHTNFRTLFTHLRAEGYYIDVLGEPLTCFDAAAYAALLIVDPEEEFFAEEVEKLRADVEERGLSVGVFADWYNVDVMRKIRFYDENTRQWWTPVTGGANVPALNRLLAPFRVALADGVYDGQVALGQPPVAATFASGAAIARFPAGGLLLTASLQDQAAQVVRGDADVRRDVAVLGLRPSAGASQGRLAVYGDSSCLDDAHKQPFCADLVHQLMECVPRRRLRPPFTHLRQVHYGGPHARQHSAAVHAPRGRLCLSQRCGARAARHRRAAALLQGGGPAPRVPRAVLRHLQPLRRRRRVVRRAAPRAAPAPRRRARRRRGARRAAKSAVAGAHAAAGLERLLCAVRDPLARRRRAHRHRAPLPARPHGQQAHAGVGATCGAVCCTVSDTVSNP